MFKHHQRVRLLVNGSKVIGIIRKHHPFMTHAPDFFSKIWIAAKSAQLLPCTCRTKYESEPVQWVFCQTEFKRKIFAHHLPFKSKFQADARLLVIRSIQPRAKNGAKTTSFLFSTIQIHYR